MLVKESIYNYIGWQWEIQASGKSEDVVGVVEHVETALEDFRLGEYFIDLARVPFIALLQWKDKLFYVVLEEREIVPSDDISVRS